ncbi:MAG: GNAT family N-acetyltransferase [Candidatus Lokiarchaeota archaeon]|nr:GNAT family N-acetyltransferase [Candidatus Lokiarchaeota archaeon]
MNKREPNLERESNVMVHGLDNWQEVYKDKKMPIASLSQIIKPGQRIFIGTGCSEPQTLTAELIKKQSRIADCEIIHFLTLGKNQFFSDFEPSLFRHNALFIGESMRNAVQEGKSDYTPIMLSDIPPLITSGQKHIDIALIQVSPPDKYGFVSLGINVDINKTVIDHADIVIAQINPQMPRTYGDTFVHMTVIDHWILVDEPLIEAKYQEPDEISQNIGKYISRLVENGSTIQMGIGQVPNAVIKFLMDKKDLSVYSEVFSDGVIDLVEAGVINAESLRTGRSKIMASFVMGSKRLYDWIDENPFVEFRPTSYINNILNISKNEQQISINAALTVDLTGQVNSDSIGNQFYSGIGGQADFERGAALSHRGKPIMALPSTTADGKKSRIVPVLEEGAGVVLPRGDVHYVVTEYGYANLHGKTIRERALLLIGIAHPKYRESLLKEAKRLNYVYPDQILPKTQDGVVVIYPELYESDFETDSGKIVHFRPVKFTDERLLQELYYSLSMDDRVLRFFSPQKSFPHKQTQPKVAVDYQNTMAIVGLVGEEGKERIVAAGSYYLNQNTNMAEIAFTVREEWRNQGLTRRVIEILARIAQEKGIRGFNGEVLPDNKPMIHILQTLPYKVQFRDYEGEMMFSFEFEDKK